VSDQSSQPGLQDDHFLVAMAIKVTYADGAVRGSAEILPSMWRTGSRRPRLAILASFVDVVGGHIPDGPRNPTIDLRIQLTDTVPEAGEVELIGRALRVGRRLVVAETTLYDQGRPFALSTTTFMNRVMGPTPFGAQKRKPSTLASYEKLVNAQVVDENTLEVEPIAQLANGVSGTIQGGVQALVAELAVEHLLGPDIEVVDLDIRYLDRMSVGPLRATATAVGHTGELSTTRVRLYDAGNDNLTVSDVALLARSS